MLYVSKTLEKALINKRSPLFFFLENAFNIELWLPRGDTHDEALEEALWVYLGVTLTTNSYRPLIAPSGRAITTETNPNPTESALKSYSNLTPTLDIYTMSLSTCNGELVPNPVSLGQRAYMEFSHFTLIPANSSTDYYQVL